MFVRIWMALLALAALLLVLCGAEPWRDAALAIGAQWNVLLFILGLMGVSAVAEESGAFTLVARVVVRRSEGSLRRLFVLLFAAGALLTVLLSNDATAIVFTPIVYRAVAGRISGAMPFLFACTFVADTASFGLPFANPANVIVLPRPDIGDYLVHLAVPQVVAIALNLAVFLAIFRRELRGRYEMGEEEEAVPRSAPRALLAACGVAVAYLVALVLHAPLGPVAVLGAVGMMLVARVPLRPLHRHVSWSTFALLAALFVLVDAIARAGLLTWALHGLDVALARGPVMGIGAAAGAAVLLSVILNNLPVAVASAYVAAHASWPHIAYALIAGVDLGPNLMTTGSLATILWMTALRRRGVRVSALEYTKLGLLSVPPMLAATLAWLWLVR